MRVTDVHTAELLSDLAEEEEIDNAWTQLCLDYNTQLEIRNAECEDISKEIRQLKMERRIAKKQIRRNKKLIRRKEKLIRYFKQQLEASQANVDKAQTKLDLKIRLLQIIFSFLCVCCLVFLLVLGFKSPSLQQNPLTQLQQQGDLNLTNRGLNAERVLLDWQCAVQAEQMGDHEGNLAIRLSESCSTLNSRLADVNQGQESLIELIEHLQSSVVNLSPFIGVDLKL